MMIFCSILLVSVAFIISSRIYKKMYPEMKLNSEEVVLIPLRYVLPNPKISILHFNIQFDFVNVHFILKSSYWPLLIMSFDNTSCLLLIVSSDSS